MTKVDVSKLRDLGYWNSVAPEGADSYIPGKGWATGYTFDINEYIKPYMYYKGQEVEIAYRYFSRFAVGTRFTVIDPIIVDDPIYDFRQIEVVGTNNVSYVLPKQYVRPYVPVFAQELEYMHNNTVTLKHSSPEPSPLSLPSIDSLWRHRNGSVYKVDCFRNTKTQHPDKHPVTVLYSNYLTASEWSRPLNEWSRSFTELSFKHNQLVDIDLTRSDISIENLMDTCLPDRLDCTEDMEELINKLWPALLKLQITKQLKKE